MKKYYQAALALTAALSLVALLFYRHEYNKLRFVLQVFNYFGTPSSTPNETCSLAPITHDLLINDFSEPTSTWQRLSDDLHVFSAYQFDNQVRVLAFGNPGPIKTKHLSCSIITNPENPKRTPGELSFEITSQSNTLDLAYINNTKLYGLILICSSPRTEDRGIAG